MADWPTVDELRLILGVTDDPDVWGDTLDRVLAAAIAVVKREVGNWDEGLDEPDEMLAQAALRAAERLSERPDVAIAEAIAGRAGSALLSDPVFTTLMLGHRRRFAVS